MPATLTDARALAVSITSAAGTVPAPLSRLLSTADLLMAPGAAAAPLQPVVDAALRGELDQRKLDKMLDAAAQQAAAANFRKELRQIAEPAVVQAFHQELKNNGGADLVLDSLRDQFTKHAQAIEVARDLIPRETDLSQWLADAKPQAVTAWQQLPGHLSVLDRIGRIVASFGSRPSAHFPLFAETGYSDSRLVSDVALFCANGDSLAADSAPFLRLGPAAHRASPWFAVPLRLNTVEQARARFEAWNATEWDKSHAQRVVQFTKPDGTLGEMELINPHRAKAEELAT
jgi:hypothetical protein